MKALRFVRAKAGSLLVASCDPTVGNMAQAALREAPVRAFLRSPWRFALLAGLGLTIGSLLHAWTVISVIAPTVRSGEGSATPISFPYSVQVNAGQVLEFAFTIHEGMLTQRSIVFVPDDHFVSLTVNGRDVPLEGIDSKQRDDYHHGFSFPIGSYLHRGDNSVVARVLNTVGPGGLDVTSDPHDWRNRVECLAGVVAFLVLLTAALRWLKVPWTIAIAFIFGAATRFAYLSVTPYSLRTHDVEGHIAYIEYILNHGSLPGAYDGWSFYQPPLYFALAAGLWKVLTLGGVRSRETILCALQVQSLLYQLGFLAFSLRTASLWLGRLPDATFGRGVSSRSGLVALFAAMLCLWPSGVIHAVRIGNDDLLYLWFGAGVYFASRWWIVGRDRDLNFAAACGALGMFTKTNSLLLFVLLGVLLVARFFSDRERRIGRYLKRAWPSALMFCLSTGVALGRAVIDTASGKRSSVLVGNAGRLQADLAVGNRAPNYLWFDTNIFVTQAFSSSFDDAKGRQFFWNVTLKTSLFGDFAFDNPHLSDLAVVLSLLLLFIVACVLLGVALSSPKDWLRELPALVITATLVSSLAALRVSIPMACSGDFRYILPLLTPALYLYVRSLTLFRERGWTRFSGTGAFVGWSFVACSALFFILLTATG
jgi:hypothetical protein